MIKNAREYQITKAQAVRFETAMESVKARTPQRDIDAVECDALKSQLDDLGVQIDEYDALKSGRLKAIEVSDLNELPLALIQARIAGGLSQRELGERLGLKEQQVQRYEATEYASASLSRVREVVEALGVRLRQDVVFPSADLSLRTLIKQLQRLGFERGFIETRLVVDDVENPDAPAWKTANAVGRVLGLATPDLVAALDSGGGLGDVAATALFKLPGNARESKTHALAAYAHYLAKRVVACTRDQFEGDLPSHPVEVWQAMVRDYGGISFKAALSFVWDRGIPVLPLADEGAFHGAFWRISGRPVIVIKQGLRSEGRWLIDLLHEYYHAVQTIGETEAEVIEVSASPFERQNSQEEREATQWATAAALGGREQELAEMCVADAGKEVLNLKRVVTQVARREGVLLEVLANYVAYRLALFGEADWWGTASNLRDDDAADPWEIARNALLENIRIAALDPLDRELLGRALAGAEV